MAALEIYAATLTLLNARRTPFTKGQLKLISIFFGGGQFGLTQRQCFNMRIKKFTISISIAM